MDDELTQLKGRIAALEREATLHRQSLDRVLTLATGTLGSLVQQGLVTPVLANQIFATAIESDTPPVRFNDRGGLEVVGTATGEPAAVLLDFAAARAKKL